MSFSQHEVDHILRTKQVLADILQGKQTLFEQSYNSDLFIWLKTYCRLSGGATASVLQGEHPNDFDFYFVDSLQSHMEHEFQENFLKEDARYQHLIESCNPAYMGMEIEGKVITVNAITMKHGIQIIRLAPLEVSRRSFDFIHCLPVYDWQKLYISKMQYDSVLQRRLIPNPTGQLTDHRIDKFKQRGWKI